MTSNFYREFEERHYASRDVIKQLRRQYIPFIKELAKKYPGGQTFDFGCGRGEWLELMLEVGLSPYGVDLDDGMLQACSELKLPATKGDAVEFISLLDNNSQVVVSSFHVVEHITFDELQILVSEALRVLKPGGLLIIETPNPENIKVATESFYLDPTHIRPIPSKLLSFLTEFHGYTRTKVLRLQEAKELVDKKSPNLLEVMGGVSLDYAVVAQKEADGEMLMQFDNLFTQDYGLSLDELANRFENRLQLIEFNVGQKYLDQLTEKFEKSMQVLELKVEHQNQELQTIYNSTSWTITWPLRNLSRLFRGLLCFPIWLVRLPKRVLQRLLVKK